MEFKKSHSGIFYARALALHSSRREGTSSIERMLETEMSLVATSMFDDQGKMRATQKSYLKSDLAIQSSLRDVQRDSNFVDGCAVLWVVAWSSSNSAIVQDYIDAFRAHIHRYQEVADVYLIFYRYVDNSGKEMT